MVGAGGHALWLPSSLSVLCGASPRVHLSFPFWPFWASSQRLSTRPLSRRSPTPFFMASLLCCGPKLAACGIVLSAWGVIMLIMLGIFFNVHSAVLIEDVPFTEKDFENGPQNIYNLYEQVSYNCFIAAGLYLLLGGFSFCQVRLNKRKEYMVR
ncbi:ribonuclease kappa [Pteropus medius]|uniref:ribonuclease kappa n=1 Tax=Pteropus vampyrus TaxID=132908 RepID=UPI00196A6561|nr:ribonuclease kappa [Pteropus giganteus]